MTGYAIPEIPAPAAPEPRVVHTVASGDLRLAANVTCWPTQAKLEEDFAAAVSALGWSVRRGHPIDAEAGHGFIDSQRAGMEVFKHLPPDAPLVVVEAVWQYSHHVLPGLRTHRGPILLVANWSGELPGLVGMLNLTASLTKAGVRHSVLWSEDFTDDWARERLQTWLDTGELSHDTSHVRALEDAGSGPEVDLGRALAAQLQLEKAIIGVFDEGCMGMYNAIIDDELLNALGIYKERLSQSALVAEMGGVLRRGGAGGPLLARRRGDDVPHGRRRGDGPHRRPAAEPVQDVRRRVAHRRRLRLRRGRDPVPAGVEGRGARQRPRRGPAQRRPSGRPCAAETGLASSTPACRCRTSTRWTSAPRWTPWSPTASGRRWGSSRRPRSTTSAGATSTSGRFVWVFEISGSVPASHNGGYDKSWSMRQPPMYFPLGGGTLSGVSKPGAVVWSRVFIMDGALHVDIGRATALALPEEETERRLAGHDAGSGRSCTPSCTGSRGTRSWPGTRPTT